MITYEPKVTYLSTDRIFTSKEFIERNNLKLKSVDEICEIYKELGKDDFLGFSFDVFAKFVPFEKAKYNFEDDFINKVESGLEKWTFINTIEEASQDFLDYMNFAWGKAEDKRGISASRSIEKLSMFLRIMGREDLAELIDDDDLYNPYGAPALIAVCDKMGIQVPDSLREFAKVKCEE